MSVRPADRAISWLVPVLVAVVPYAWPLWFQGPNQRRAGTALLVAGTALTAAARLRRPLGARLLLTVGAGALLALATEPHAGRTPIVLLLAALALALAPSPEGATRPGPGPARVLPLAAAGLSWMRVGSAREALAGLVVAAAVLAAERWRPRTVHRFDRRFGIVAGHVGHVVSIVVLAIVAIPVLLLPVWLSSPLRRRRERRQRAAGSTWQARRIDPADERRDARRPFAPAPAGQRRALNAAGAVVVSACLVFVGVQVANRNQDPSADPPGERNASPLPPATAVPDAPSTTAPDGERDPHDPPLSERPAFADVPFADDIEAETLEYGTQHLPLDDELGHRLGDFDGEFIEVDDGERRTLAPTCDGCATATVWLLGGSAAFGWNQRDEATIASELVRQAGDAGIALTVHNFGVPGWTSDQEATRLAQLLDSDRPLPDAIVVYDGFNDVIGAVAEAAATGRLDPKAPNVLDGEQLNAYATSPSSLDRAGGPEAVAAVAARRHSRAQERVAEAVGDRDLDVTWVLQPDAFASTRQLEAIRGVTGQDPDVVARADIALALTAFHAALRDDVVDLRDVLDVAEPVFSDPSHTNERGAQLAASAVLAALLDDIEPRPGS